MTDAATAERMDPVNLIGADATPIGGDAIVSHNPAHPDEVVWSGSPGVEAVPAAIAAASEALEGWRRTSLDERVKVVRAFQAIASERVEQIGELICRETGKAIWDSMGEAKLLAELDLTNKVPSRNIEFSGECLVTDRSKVSDELTQLKLVRFIQR